MIGVSPARAFPAARPMLWASELCADFMLICGAGRGEHRCCWDVIGDAVDDSAGVEAERWMDPAVLRPTTKPIPTRTSVLTTIGMVVRHGIMSARAGAWFDI